MGGSAIVADVRRRGPGRLFISIAPSRRRAGASWGHGATAARAADRPIRRGVQVLAPSLRPGVPQVRAISLGCTSRWRRVPAAAVKEPALPPWLPLA